MKRELEMVEERVLRTSKITRKLLGISVVMVLFLTGMSIKMLWGLI